MGSVRPYCSTVDAILTYLCYLVILLVGYVNDFIRPEGLREKHRSGYVNLYASFESFYCRHVYRKVRNYWFIPVSSVPGKYITLIERVTPDNGRTLIITGREKEAINLGSYNYLGFAENNGLCAQAAIEAARNFGIATSATRLELGTSVLHIELEELTAQFLGTDDAITFGMGFATNVLNIPSILGGKGSLVLSDEKNHASIILGVRLSGAVVRLFRHNDMESLEKKLREGIVEGQPRTHSPWRKVFIFVEGVYSMEGSIVPLPQVIALKKKYGAYVYLDEAHSIGALGPRGRGVVDYFGLNPTDVDVLMGTFTKSFGSCGGYIGGSGKIIQLLRRQSYAQYYGTSMSPPIAQQIITSMRTIMNEENGIERVKQLHENTLHFRQKMKELGFRLYGNPDSPVVPVAASMPTQVSYVLDELNKRGVATAGAIYPAAPILEGRVRFCMSASHSTEMLNRAIAQINRVGDVLGIKN